MRFFYFVTALLSATCVTCLPVREADKIPVQCADPTFACQDLENARLCGVVKTCIHDIWSTMSAPEDNDEICDLCKEMVKEARDQLLSNMTQEEIKEVFEGSCKLLPVKLVAEACIKIVDEFIPELVEMLASRMDPTMVCTVSGLCNLAHLPIEDHLHKLFRVAVKNTNDKCSECITIVTDAKDIASSTPEDQLKSMALKFCRSEASSIICEVFIHSYFEPVYKYLISVNPNTACKAANMCPSTNCRVNEAVKLEDNLTCEFCTHVLEHIKEMIIANTTKEEFRTALLNFCKHTGQFSDKCTEFVNDYYDMLFDYIQKLDTKGACTLLGLCNNQICEQKVIPAVKLVAAMPVRKVSSISAAKLIFPAMTVEHSNSIESNEIFEPSDFQLPVERLGSPSILLKANIECPFCKAISFYLKTDLNDDRSPSAVKSALTKVCDKWLTGFPEQCRSFINKYSAKIEMHLVKKANFDEICSLVNVCELEKKGSVVNVRVISSDPNGTLCDLCKDTFDEIEKQLKNPDTKTKVENFADQFCNKLPQSLQKDCSDFVNQNVDSIFQILEEELRSDNICPALRLCPSYMKAVKSVRVKNIECDLCKEIVTELENELKDEKTEEAIKKALEKVCTFVPSSLTAKCKEFVDNYSQLLITILIEEMDPDAVCAELNICPGSTKIVHQKKVKDIECDVCTEIVAEVEKKIKDQRTEEAIREALDKVCSYLPSSMGAKCKKFVDTYTDLLITILAEEMDPKLVCAALKVCPANTQHLMSRNPKAQDIECQGCQDVLHFLQEQLTNSDLQGQIKNVMKKVCDVLPSVLSKNCVAFVDEYGDSLLVLIAQEIDPSILCKELGACTNKKHISKFPLPRNNMVSKLDECSVCVTVVDYMDKLLEDDDVDKEVTAIIEKVCSIMPASARDKCASIVETYSPYILQMIGQLANSKQVCQEIDMCPTPPGHVHLLGGKKCTFGPSYWCQSEVHASSCKANMYCAEKVWKN